MSDAVAVPHVAQGGEAMKMDRRHGNNNEHRLQTKEAREERQRRILELKDEHYTYEEIGAMVGVNASTVGYYVQKAEGSLPPSVAARAAKGISKLTGSKPPKRSMAPIATDFQREALLEGLADSLWSRLSVSDKVRIIQQVQKEEV